MYFFIVVDYISEHYKIVIVIKVLNERAQNKNIFFPKFMSLAEVQNIFALNVKYICLNYKLYLSKM